MPHQLQTERLVLRPFTRDDIPAAYPLFEGDSEVWQYDPGFARSYEQRATIIQKYAAHNEENGVGTLAVCLKTDGTLMGYVGLQLYVLPRVPLATPEVELYYKLGRAYWGQGYALEASVALRQFAFTEMRLQRIVTIAAAVNERSLALMRRLGMTLEPAPPSWPGDVMGTVANSERD